MCLSCSTMLAWMVGEVLPDFSETMSTWLSTGCRGCTSPPKMQTVLSRTERTCDERRSLSSLSMRFQLPLSMLIGIVAVVSVSVSVSMSS